MDNKKNAFKVGVAIVVALLVIIFGIRYFEDIPLGGSYEIVSEFDRIDGLIPGNPVLIRGVRVGSVKSVELNQETQRVQVRMRLDKGITVPTDSYAEITGFSALGGVKMHIEPGQAPAILQPEDAIESREVNLLSSASKIAEPYVEQIDTILANLDATLQAMQFQLNAPNSDTRQMLTSMNTLTATLNETIRAERQTLSGVLLRLDTTLVSFNQFASTGTDSLAQTMHEMNLTLAQTRTTLEGLAGVSTNLNSLLAKIDAGEGTLGLMANDPALYHKLDSTATQLTRFLTDFQNNPKRYLGQLKLVDLF